MNSLWFTVEIIIFELLHLLNPLIAEFIKKINKIDIGRNE